MLETTNEEFWGLHKAESKSRKPVCEAPKEALFHLVNDFKFMSEEIDRREIRPRKLVATDTDLSFLKAGFQNARRNAKVVCVNRQALLNILMDYSIMIDELQKHGVDIENDNIGQDQTAA